MRVPGLKTAKKISRWLQARILGGALILGYHRVAQVVRDEYEVCITPERFAEQMDVLKKYAHPISLTKLVECLKSNSLPSRSVAVTFDDGYVDNLFNAKPILEKYQVPATVFVCTGYAGREFWWDELERLIMTSQTDMGTLRLQIGKKSFEWIQPKVSPEAGSPEDVSNRRNFRHTLYNFLLQLDTKDQNDSMNKIRDWSRISSDETLPVRSMRHDEILQLADGGLVEIGAHTRSHPMLSRLSLDRQKDEIISSKQDLEEILGRRVDGFAFPNGEATDDSKKIVRKAGFAFACMSLHDVVRPASDIHKLTRFWQKDVDGDTFLKSLRLWMKDI